MATEKDYIDKDLQYWYARLRFPSKWVLDRDGQLIHDGVVDLVFRTFDRKELIRNLKDVYHNLGANIQDLENEAN